MILQLKEVKFFRCVKPENVDPTIDPDLATFCDGNPNCYGVVAYIIFTHLDGTKTSSLLMSKAKLGPLTHSGETSRNELSGATIASRIKVYVQ